MQLPIHKVPKIAVQNTEKSDHKQDLKIILSNWSFLFNGKKLWESRNLPIQFVVKMKTHLQIAPFMFFLSHIHKKRPRGVYNEAKNLKISWFYAGERCVSCKRARQAKFQNGNWLVGALFEKQDWKLSF